MALYSHLLILDDRGRERFFSHTKVCNMVPLFFGGLLNTCIALQEWRDFFFFFLVILDMLSTLKKGLCGLVGGLGVCVLIRVCVCDVL